LAGAFLDRRGDLDTALARNRGKQGLEKPLLNLMLGTITLRFGRRRAWETNHQYTARAKKTCSTRRKAQNTRRESSACGKQSGRRRKHCELEKKKDAEARGQRDTATTHEKIEK